jgi:hypothetical protein
VRRQSEAVTALLLIQSRALTSLKTATDIDTG